MMGKLKGIKLIETGSKISVLQRFSFPVHNILLIHGITI